MKLSITTLITSDGERAKAKRIWPAIIFALLVLTLPGFCLGQTQPATQASAQTPEDRLREILQNLEPDNTLRHALEGGWRGDGIHYFWMDMMKERGVKQATFVIRFQGTKYLKITDVNYLLHYYRYDTAIDEPSKIEQIRAIGLEQSLSSEILERAKTEVIQETRTVGSTSICGTLYLNLLDDEILPVLDEPADVDYCKNVGLTNLPPGPRRIHLTAKAIGAPKKLSGTPPSVVSGKTYHKVLDLVFPRDILNDQKSDHKFVLRYEPTFRAESQITITERGGQVEVIRYFALDSIETRLNQMVQRTQHQDAKRMAKQIRIKKEYMNLTLKDLKLLQESFFEKLRLSERAWLDPPKDEVMITADGTSYRLWYRGETEVQTDFIGSNMTTPTRRDESPLLDWMKSVYLKVNTLPVTARR